MGTSWNLVHDVLFPLLGFLAVILLGLLGYLASRLYDKLENIPKELAAINETLHKIEVELRKELANHAERIGVVETKIRIYHTEEQ